MAKKRKPEKLSPCEQCPWRTSNHGKRHTFGFFTKANLRRLWNQIRRGGRPQSCHMTDASHPHHVACGAKPGSAVKECAGAAILAIRELMLISDLAKDGVIDTEHIDTYLQQRKWGLTRSGLQFWLIARGKLGGMPIIGGAPLPDVDLDDKRISLPVSIGATPCPPKKTSKS